jgi:hypothetical protein
MSRGRFVGECNVKQGTILSPSFVHGQLRTTPSDINSLQKLVTSILHHVLNDPSVLRDHYVFYH